MIYVNSMVLIQIICLRLDVDEMQRNKLPSASALGFTVLCRLYNISPNLFTFSWLLEFPDLRIVTQRASSELSADLLAPVVWHIDFPSRLVDDIRYCTVRISGEADDPTQMKWGWYQVRQDKRLQGTPPCIPCWVWIFVNVDEAAAPEPLPSCCQTPWLLQAFMIDEWDALGAAGRLFLSIVPFNQEWLFSMGTTDAGHLWYFNKVKSDWKPHNRCVITPIYTYFSFANKALTCFG